VRGALADGGASAMAIRKTLSAAEADIRIQGSTSYSSYPAALLPDWASAAIDAALPPKPKIGGLRHSGTAQPGTAARN
jgi:hypothetical protein